MNTTPTPDKKMTPMEELIEQLKKLSPESPMGNDVSKAFHGGIQLAIIKAKFLLEAEREYASQQAPAMYTRAIGIIKKLAEWSWEYPRETIYSTSNKKMDDELVSIEKEAMQFIQSLK